MLKTFLLGILLLLIVVMVGRRGIRLARCRLTTIDQASRRIASKLMILMAALLSLSLRRSASGVRIVSWLLTDGFVICDVRSSTAIARHLLWPHSHLSTLGLYRTPFTLDLVKALLAILLISILDGLHYGVLIGDHTFSEHRRRSIGVIRILTAQYLLVFFGIYLGLVLSLREAIYQVTAVGGLVQAKAS